MGTLAGQRRWADITRPGADELIQLILLNGVTDPADRPPQRKELLHVFPVITADPLTPVGWLRVDQTAAHIGIEGRGADAEFRIDKRLRISRIKLEGQPTRDAPTPSGARHFHHTTVRDRRAP